MKIIFGLGNPGAKYARSRLNAGTIVVDAIVFQLANIYPRKLDFVWTTTQKYQIAPVAVDPITILVKPRSYLADIGPSVNHLVTFYFKNMVANLFKVDNGPIIKLGEIRREDASVIEESKVQTSTTTNSEEVDLSNLYLVHFDTEIAIGEYSIETSKSNNKYVLAVANSLKSDAFWKIRVGVKGESSAETEDAYLRETLTDVDFALLKNVGKNIITDLKLITE